ncbi:MAG: hypothetical protein M3N68_14550, partial [Actinomycetota bacterium]|nr:hypothetical protein [Actinomycetota bacterium]
GGRLQDGGPAARRDGPAGAPEGNLPSVSGGMGWFEASWSAVGGLEGRGRDGWLAVPGWVLTAHRGAALLEPVEGLRA